MAIGGHHSARMKNDEWLTPPEIITSLGVFDLDPCASRVRPWPTAKNHYTIDDDGLALPWTGRVWLNPPYGQETAKWLSRMVNHGNGIVLIFARTDTEMFVRYVWKEATAVLFIYGRVYFHYPNGNRAKDDSGAPSVLVAYGTENARALMRSGIDGKYLTWERNKDDWNQL